jgi:diguanylate cyclase (GGDEF)-like protein
LCFFGLLFSLSVYADSNVTSEIKNDYSVELLTEEDGFVSSEIYSIVQDNQGLLWFGTAENGAMRYDGRKVTVFGFHSLNSKKGSLNDAGNLMLDHNGKIWIGTWGEGAKRYDPPTGQLQHIIHNPLSLNSLSSDRIQTLFHDKEGTFWLGTYDKGLNKYISDNNFEHIGKIDGVKSSLSHNRIWDIEDNDNNSLWIATSFGLNLYDKQKKIFSHFLPDPNNQTPSGANEIRNILKTSNNKIYIGTQEGPFLFDKKNGLFTPLTTFDGLYLGQVNSMIEDQEGNLWFVTNKGLFRQSNSSSQIEEFLLENNHSLRIIFEDSARTLWVTSETHGIYKIIPHSKFKTINNPALTVPNGIATDTNGDILILSSSSQLYKWEVSTQKLKTLSLAIFSDEYVDLDDRLLEPPILLPDNNNNIWIAQGDGLAKFNLITKEIDLIKYPESDPNHMGFRALSALNIDQHGNIWIGTYKNSVYRYNPNTKTFVHLDDSKGLTHPEILDIFKDNNHNIWIGTGDGINLWQEKNQKFIPFKADNKVGSLFGNIVQDIHQSRDGKIWVATQKGLNLYLPESKTFRNLNSENGLTTVYIRSIEDDENGYLWLTTKKGVLKFNPLSEEMNSFNSYNGLSGSNYYANSLVKGMSGFLFASSPRGIEFFDTAKTKKYNDEHSVILTSFNKMGKSVKLNKPYSYITDIHISYLDYFFSFEFSVLDFTSPNKNKYAYKLEGYDDNWIDIGNRNVASFTNLNGGSYKLLVKATNSSGKWGNKFLSINLYIYPPPWKTWWAYGLYILVSILTVLLFIYLRTRSHKAEIIRQKQFVITLEEQVAEKTASLNEQAKDLIKVNEKLKILTYKDGLTGLYNRRFFDQKLTEEINRHRREKQPLSLILCDLDHFKLFNDFYGHQKGDDCLKKVSQCICDSVGRLTDANCRYGGEEFAIILPNTSIVQSTLVADRLCLAIENIKIPHEKSTTNKFVTLTLGVVTVIPDYNTSVDSVVLSADKALYLGKFKGRNKVARAE